MGFRSMRRSAALVCALVVAGCSSDGPLAPHHAEDNGFTSTYSGPFVVDHIQPVTFRHAGDVHETLSVTFNSQNTAGIVDGTCPRQSLGVSSRCLSYTASAGQSTGITCEAAGSDLVCTAQIYAFAPGTISINVQVGTEIANFTYPVDPQRAVKIQPLSRRIVTQLGGAKTFFVQLLDQLGAPIRNTKPTVVPRDPALAQVTGIEPTQILNTTVTDYLPGWGDSVAVTVVGLKPGATSLRVSLGSATADIPAELGAVVDDSAVVTANGKTIDVTANDAAGAAGVRIVRGPNNASATVVDHTIQVQPVNGYYGPDSLIYVASAGGRTDTAKVRLVMMPGPYSVAGVVDVTTDYYDLGMNDSGQVYATVTLGDGTKRAVRWTAGKIDTLQYGGAATIASGIASSGTVVGMSGSTAVLWRAGSTNGESILGDAGSGISPRISSGGTIVVTDTTQPPRFSFNYNHFIVRNGAIERRATHVYTAEAVDDAGDYVGLDILNSMYPEGLIHYADDHIGVFGGRGTSIGGMNNHGAVALNAGLSGSDPIYRPMLFDGSSQIVLSNVYKTLVFVSRINDAGWISGGSSANNGGIASSPALGIGGALAPLQSLLADQSLHADAIVTLSNSGRILARITGADGPRLVVLTPPQ